ncbi:winged helix-turn-helix domain-containing protein [Micromonospora sp. NPDC048063]|uniref:winged helix-turn-helix domain-containing protein n=1 Tax=Micromonospora sp. NPDC048063 TaxID=3364256 RepID=UPI003719C806
MSVVALTPRPQSTDRPGPVRPRSAPTLTITLDVAPGPLSPRLARLLELIGELAESGEGRVRPAAAEGPPAAPRPAQAVAHPGGAAAVADPGPAPDAGRPDGVRILAGPRVVHHGSRAVALTRIEYDLLLFLAERPRQVFTRLQLLANVWGYEHAVARTVDVHVRRLRAKFGADTPLVTTVHGVGYRLADEARIEVDRSR